MQLLLCSSRVSYSSMMGGLLMDDGWLADVVNPISGISRQGGAMMRALLTMTSVIVLLVCCCGRPHMCASACCRRGLSLLRKKECRSTTGTYCWSKVCEAYMSCHTMHDAAGRARGMWDSNVRLVPSPLAPEPHMASGSMLFACCKLGFC